jgi:hypothetical protein
LIQAALFEIVHIIHWTPRIAILGGALRALRAPHGANPYLLSSATVWANTLGTAGAFAIAYLLAARLGLALLSEHSDVAVSWPASGIAPGLLILLGRRARSALLIRVVIGTFAANLMSDRGGLRVATAIAA